MCADRVRAEPEALIKFAQQLDHFNAELATITKTMLGRYKELEDTWEGDTVYRKFDQEFRQTVKVIEGFIPASNDHVRFLKKKAAELQPYLGR